MKPPDQRATDLVNALRQATGETAGVILTAEGRFRISFDKPTGLTMTETSQLLRLLRRADRFGNSSSEVWAEIDTRPTLP